MFVRPHVFFQPMSQSESKSEGQRQESRLLISSQNLSPHPTHLKQIYRDGFLSPFDSAVSVSSQNTLSPPDYKYHCCTCAQEFESYLDLLIFCNSFCDPVCKNARCTPASDRAATFYLPVYLTQKQ